MSTSTLWAAETKELFTQKAFVQLLFQHLSWDQGLSKESSDREYLQILGGKRTFKYEAENAFNEKTDRVTVRSFSLYGPYTGKGWILGVSDTTNAVFTTLLPIKGEYALKVVIKGNGFIWDINGNKYAADSKSDVFREIEIGKIYLEAGIVKIQVSIPPEGAIDSFTFTAPDNMPVQPFAGWRFKESLTAVQLAEILLSITGEHDKLREPQQKVTKKLAVFEAAIIPTSAAKTVIEEFGRFYSREWVRSDYRGASIQIPLKNSQAGFYRITANVMGGLVTGSVNEAQFEVLTKPYLANVQLGTFRLESGDNLITINLPPMAGIDLLELNMKSMNPDDLLSLSRVKGPSERIIQRDEAETVLKTILVSKPVRR
jgi:hypothetical protein